MALCVGHLSFFKGMVPRRVPLPARQLREHPPALRKIRLISSTSRSGCASAGGGRGWPGSGCCRGRRRSPARAAASARSPASPLPRVSTLAALRCFASDVHSHAARVQPLAGWQGRAGCSRRSSGGGGGGGDPLRAFTRQRTTALARSRRGARHRRKAGRALRRRSKEPDRWPRDGADGAAPRPRTAMGAVLIP